jgi:hypothetical protein
MHVTSEMLGVYQISSIYHTALLLTQHLIYQELASLVFTILISHNMTYQTLNSYVLFYKEMIDQMFTSTNLIYLGQIKDRKLLNRSNITIDKILLTIKLIYNTK